MTNISHTFYKVIKKAEFKKRQHLLFHIHLKQYSFLLSDHWPVKQVLIVSDFYLMKMINWKLNYIQRQYINFLS